MKRKIIYHYGPTNSGKTMSALKRLVNAESGVYCAPLRLLAWEIYEKIIDAGKSCTLLTGEERRINPESKLLSCTIEMVDPEAEYEVGVIVSFIHQRMRYR